MDSLAGAPNWLVRTARKRSWGRRPIVCLVRFSSRHYCLAGARRLIACQFPLAGSHLARAQLSRRLCSLDLGASRASGSWAPGAAAGRPGAPGPALTLSLRLGAGAKSAPRLAARRGLARRQGGARLDLFKVQPAPSGRRFIITKRRARPFGPRPLGAPGHWQVNLGQRPARELGGGQLG